MGAIGTLLGYLLSAFILVLVVRVVLDWVAVARRGPHWVDRARGVTHAVTEPVIAPVRRLMPPLRAGGIGIDLAFTVVFVLALILRSVAFSL
ncbi:YggT family protein [Actinokineospora pegani]|uniref:YggT family protein n=1 Tax=Actinokineospora pegani TaxID=2654637 RepID=UPI0012EAB231|nr:YggT family protein [Actinokineospora pegani]